MDQSGNSFSYGYPVTVTLPASAGAGQVGTAQEVRIQISGYDFVWVWKIAQSTGAFQCTVKDSGNSFNFMNGYVHSANFWGTGSAPSPMLVPYRFKRQSVVVLSLQDLSGASNTVNLLLDGYQLLQ